MKICIDTSVLLDAPDALFAFEECEIILPYVVLTELENNKNRLDYAGKHARQAIRYLESIRSEGSFTTGVPLPNKGSIRIVVDNIYNPSELHDDIIIRCAEQHCDVLYTNDIAMRVKANARDITTKEYIKTTNAIKQALIYSGVATMQITPKQIDKLYDRKRLKVRSEDLYQNQFVVVKSNNGTSQSALTRYFGNSLVLIHPRNIWDIQAKNTEQNFAIDLLMDPKVNLVTLMGKAGSGKTLLAVAAGLEQVLEKRRYDRIVISRPTESMGKSIGYLPGSLKEKMMPWLKPIADNLSVALGKNQQTINMLIDDETIEVEALNFMRGRSISNAFILIDECQNLGVDELKCIITRAGHNSKIVLTGDIEQIDRQAVANLKHNGLVRVIEQFKKYDLAGHVTLIKGERSRLATVASEIL